MEDSFKIFGTNDLCLYCRGTGRWSVNHNPGVGRRPPMARSLSSSPCLDGVAGIGFWAEKHSG